MGVLGEVLGAHRVNYHSRNVGGQTSDSLRYTSCEGCDWLGGHHDEVGWERHVEAALLARLADLLGSDETREVVLSRIMREWVPEWDPMPELDTDAALAAVREVLGLPEERAEGSVSDERAETGPLGVERVVEDVDGEWEK